MKVKRAVVETKYNQEIEDMYALASFWLQLSSHHSCTGLAAGECVRVRHSMWNVVEDVAAPRDVAGVPYPHGDRHIGKTGRLWRGALGGTRAEVVPASNRVSLKVAEQERLVRLARSNRTYKYMLLPDSLFRYCWTFFSLSRPSAHLACTIHDCLRR
ncbi:hypothetical protein GQ600_3380 [Phytophthora cactorum]|nr:hypothetical protein GQ600_3380 [Phytophthora cactorum]